MSKIRHGRRQDRVKRKGRTYYAINKESTDVYQFAAFEDRQYAIEHNDLDPLSAQEYLQFKAEGNICLHQMPRRVNLAESSSAPSEVIQQPPTFTESPAGPLEGASVLPSVSTEAKSEISRTETNNIPAAKTVEAPITLTVEQFKTILIAAILEAMRQYRREVAKPVSEAGTIVGEQPSGTRQNPSH